MRQAKIERETKETKIDLELNLDEKINGAIKTGVGFLDHMLDLWQAHSGFGLSVTCEGDTWVDAHHTTEDVGISLGQAMKTALGDKKGINRYGQRILPMDESLILAAMATTVVAAMVVLSRVVMATTVAVMAVHRVSSIGVFDDT